MSNTLVRVVATADNHLNRFYDRMSPQKLNQRRKYLRDGFKAAVDHALSWQAHFFLIAGDLFDQPDPRNIDRNFVATQLGRLKEADVRVYAVGGNHDTPRQSTDQGGAAPQEVYHRLQALTFFDSSDEITDEVVEVNGLRVAVGGLSPHPNWPGGSDPLANLSWQPEADLGIFLLHGQVEGYSLLDNVAPVFRLHSLEALSRADLIVVGDIHRPAMRRLGERLLVIPGATERMTFGEDPEVPGFVSVELGQEGIISYNRIQLLGQPRAELHLRAAELDQTNLFADLVEQITSVSTLETMVKVYLEGLIDRDRYHNLQLRQLHEVINTKAFHFTLDTSGLMLEDERHESAQRGVRLSQQEELRRLAAELSSQDQADAEEQRLIKQALQAILSNY